jgi:Cation transporter/ATPase, N-terminus
VPSLSQEGTTLQDHQLRSWHDRPFSELTTALNTDEGRGLAPDEAAARLHQRGRNALRPGQTISPLALLAGQFRSVACTVSLEEVKIS